MNNTISLFRGRPQELHDAFPTSHLLLFHLPLTILITPNGAEDLTRSFPHRALYTG